jgi:hypothetical protein
VDVDYYYIHRVFCDRASRHGVRWCTFIDGEILDEFYILHTWEGNILFVVFILAVMPLWYIRFFFIIFHTKRRQGALATSRAVIEGLPAPLYILLKRLCVYICMYKTREKHDHYLNLFLVPLWYLPPLSEHIIHLLWACVLARGKFTYHSTALFQMGKSFMNILW